MKAKVKTWLTNIENGNIKCYAEQILKQIKNHTSLNGVPSFMNKSSNGISTYELRNITGISHQTLTSALSNLYDEGLIQSTYQIEIEQSYYSIYEFVRDDKKRLEIITQRKKEKFEQWLKKAYSYEEFLNEATLELIDMEIFVLNNLGKK